MRDIFNYAGNISDIISVSSKSGSKVVNTSTDDTIFPEEEPDDESLEEPGSVILTSDGVSSEITLEDTPCPDVSITLPGSSRLSSSGSSSVNIVSSVDVLTTLLPLLLLRQILYLKCFLHN